MKRTVNHEVIVRVSPVSIADGKDGIEKDQDVRQR